MQRYNFIPNPLVTAISFIAMMICVSLVMFAQQLDSTLVVPTITTGNPTIDVLLQSLLVLAMPTLAAWKLKIALPEKTKAYIGLALTAVLIIASHSVSDQVWAIILAAGTMITGMLGIGGVRQMFCSYNGALKSNTIIGYAFLFTGMITQKVFPAAGIDAPWASTVLELGGLVMGTYGLFKAAAKTEPKQLPGIAG